MSLSEPVAIVVGAVATGALTGGPALWLGRRNKKRIPRTDPERVNAALEKRIKELDDRLNAQWQSRVTYLEALVENKDRELAALRGSRRGESHD